MSSRIRKLDPALVNKIAAGEVVERPASVLKELVENAIDAGAGRIDVALEEGGTKLIRVTDDGHGMGLEDLPLAVAPHATSKIQTTDDLFNVRTLGFRGEALASIASVSLLRLCSRPADRLEASELVCEDATIGETRACAAPPGTTVEVRSLFYNVPARRKFLRRPATEFAHCTEQLARLALAHPQIAFGLSHNGRSSRNLPATSSRRSRIADFYGAELAECLLTVDRQERGSRIEALFAPPEQSRASTKWQYVFLNGRYITDRRIGYAIREAFRGLVEHDRFPVVFVFITADPADFDVNVHPTKIEVRWRDAGLIQSQVLAVLRESLLSCDLTPSLRTGGSVGSLRPPGSSGAFGSSPTSSPGTAGAVGDEDAGGGGPYADRPAAASPSSEPSHLRDARQALADYLKSVTPGQARMRFQPPPLPRGRLRPSITAALGYRGPADAASETDDKHGRRPEATWTDPSSPSPSPSMSPSSPSFQQASGGERTDASQSRDESLEACPPASSVMQVHNAYLVAQTDEGIIIVDQHALHERILYEKFRERILDGPLESQRLLIPQTIEASPSRVAAAEQHADLLARLGIELSCFGPTSLAVQAFPAMLPQADPPDFVADLLDRLAESEGGESEETLLHGLLDMMACKAAVKAGDPLTTEEMLALLAHRHLVERSSNCPHGRPTALQLSTRDLERQFKRG